MKTAEATPVATVAVAFTPESIKETKEKLNKKYVYSQKTMNVLEIGLLTNKNVILFGPGGHSKSTITEDFFLEHGITPFVVTMGQGMTPDRLFGGVDIKAVKDEGKIQYLVENSFMNHEYVIFEELLDCPDYILEQLKDILSSKVFRNGSQVFPIKTKFIVGNTNRTREDYAKKDSSIKALMERFPLELEVKWKDYNRTTYEHLFMARYGKTDMLLTYILEEFDRKDKTISPRIALEAFTILEQFGPESLAYIADFAKDPGILKNALVKFGAISKLNDYRQQLDKFVEELPLEEIDKLSSISDMKEVNIKIQKIKDLDSSIQGLTVDDGLANEKADLTKKCKEIYKEYAKKIATLIASISNNA